MIKVLIDAGHYGSKYNHSPVNKDYYESAAMWKLANMLKKELEALGAKATLQRDNIDENPSLHDRGYSAKGYDLFLSLHSNACGTESVDRVVIIRGFDKKDSVEFAEKIGDTISKVMGITSKPQLMTRVHNANEWYGVMRGARDAGLTYYYILEHSFHTNRKATQWLLQDSNLEKLAKAEAELIVSYFSSKVKDEPKAEKKYYYRVRKSWEDKDSQIGAYTVLNNAKKACKEGYFVFDEEGKVVYPEPVVPTAPVEKKDNEAYVWEYLKNNTDYTYYGIAGLMGNLQAESNFKSTNLQNTFEKRLGMTDAEYTKAVDNGDYDNFVRDSAGYGLAQWTWWSRKEALLKFAKESFSSIGDLDMQLEFLVKELKGYKKVHEVLLSADSVREASDIVLTEFERPADQSEKVQIKRAGYGEAIYEKYMTPVEEEVVDNVYIVNDGDTLSKVAREYKTTVKELAALNNIEDVDMIYVGQRIKVK